MIWQLQLLDLVRITSALCMLSVRDDCVIALGLDREEEESILLEDTHTLTHSQVVATKHLLVLCSAKHHLQLRNCRTLAIPKKHVWILLRHKLRVLRDPSLHLGHEGSKRLVDNTAIVPAKTVSTSR